MRCTRFFEHFPGRRFGGGALAVYLDGQPVVDVWTGWSDRAGRVPWTADRAPMVFSATKGMAATVIHRLADRGLIDYEAPVAEYWREFGANGKSALTVREVMRHRGGLSGLRGVTQEDLLDHLVMEERLAAASPGRLLGKPAYHALTFGWLMSGLARAVTGKGMRTLIREELAEPLGTDGMHLGRPPADAPTRVAEINMPQNIIGNPVISYAARKIAMSCPVVSGRCTSKASWRRCRATFRCWTPRCRRPTGWRPPAGWRGCTARSPTVVKSTAPDSCRRRSSPG